jgi:phosphoribosylanthranilate isomerase
VTGGLTPDNVSEAAVTLGVMGVDVSSGVEQKGLPGVKDLAVMRCFIENARK